MRKRRYEESVSKPVKKGACLEFWGKRGWLLYFRVHVYEDTMGNGRIVHSSYSFHRLLSCLRIHACFKMITMCPTMTIL
jgi:hypothetical protein